MIKKRQHSGFTLIELMVAISILAVTFASLMREGAQVAKSTKLIKDKTIAHWVAMNTATRLTIDVGVNNSFPRISTSDETVEMAGMEWKVDIEIKETPNQYLRVADISVSDTNDKHSASVSVMLRNPAP